MNKIDDVDEETFRDAKSIIELLKENLTLWKEEEGENNIEDLWNRSPSLQGPTHGKVHWRDLGQCDSLSL